MRRASVCFSLLSLWGMLLLSGCDAPSSPPKEASQPVDTEDGLHDAETIKLTTRPTKPQWEGSFLSGSTEGGSYWVRLGIKPRQGNYQISITSKEIKGSPCCAFEGKCPRADDTLRVPLKDGVHMLIYPIEGGMGVWCDNFEERFQLMSFCCGGGSLAGDYVRE